jgi:hypothetical protein
VPRVKLTDRVIRSMQAPDPRGKQVLRWDLEITGLAVRKSNWINFQAWFGGVQALAN